MRVVMMLLVAALAGCSGTPDDVGGGDPSAFRITQLGPQTYEFAAKIGGDQYSWDLGDRLTVLKGPTIQHTYDFTDGTVQVILTVDRAGEIGNHRRTLEIGPGVNEAPALLLEAERDWTVPGEKVSFSGAGTTDPEGNSMRFLWNCLRTGDATRQAAHSHGGGGVPFATPSAGSGAARLANGTLPDADQDMGGEFCAAMTASKFSKNSTITGSFAKQGIYDITMVGSDGPNPTVSATFTVWVTDPGDRPDPSAPFTFKGTLVGGQNGTAQPIGGQINENLDQNSTYDQGVHGFGLELNAQLVRTNITFDPGTANDIVYQVLRNGIAKSPKTSGPLELTDLTEGFYEIEVTLRQGFNVPYELTVDAQYDMDPQKYF